MLRGWPSPRPASKASASRSTGIFSLPAISIRYSMLLSSDSGRSLNRATGSQSRVHFLRHRGRETERSMSRRLFHQLQEKIGAFLEGRVLQAVRLVDEDHTPPAGFEFE